MAVVARAAIRSSARSLIRGFNAFSRGAAYVGVERRMPADVRRAYVAPYDSWGNRIATLRFMQDIPLREGDPAWALVAAGGRALQAFADRPAFIGWGLRDFVFDKHVLDDVHARVAECAKCRPSTTPTITCSRTSMKCWCRRSARSSIVIRWTLSDTCNIAASLPALARERGAQWRCVARVAMGVTTIAITYAELDRRSDAIAAGLARAASCAARAPW